MKSSSFPVWTYSAISWLLPVYLTRVYVAPVVLVCLFFPWALETRKPLLVAGSAAIKTGWELQGVGILTPLIAVALFSLYCYLARPARPRPTTRCIVGGLAILALQLEIGLASVDFNWSITDHQPAYTIAITVAYFYTLSIIFEAGVILWKRFRRKTVTAQPFLAAEPNILLSSESSTREVVLLIHGTGAAAEDDRGSAWWQVDSEFASRLQESLPSSVRVQNDGEVFHWSGKNSESERRHAGHALFEYLRRLNKNDVKIHLVGHSHGGSVILHALKRAVSTRTELPNLKSWTTLGTPFIHYRTSLSIIPVLLIPIGAAAALLFSGTPLDHIIETWPHLAEEGYFPTLAALALLGTVVAAVITYNLRSLLRLLVSFARLRRNKKIEEQAMTLYGDCWKCVWSESDEAIGGLQRATGFEGRLILPIPSDEETLSGRIREVLTAPARFFFNYIGRPVLNDAISSRLRRFAQGNDQGIAEAYNVSPWPQGGDNRPSLSPDVEQQVVETADFNAAQSVGALRSLLGASAVAPLDMAGVSIAVAGRLTGKELVHCGYYQLEAVTDKIAIHIASFSRGATCVLEYESPNNTAASKRGETARPDAGVRSDGSPIARWLFVGLELAVLAGAAGIVHILDDAVLDRFRADRQVKEVLYSSFHRALGASLHAGNVDAVLEFRSEMDHAGWSLPGDQRIDFLAFQDLVKDGRFDAAQAKLETFKHPFYATTAFTILRGVSSDPIDPKSLALSPELKIDMNPFVEIAPMFKKAGVLDELTASALRLRGLSMNPDPLNVGIRKLFGRLDWGWITDSETAAAREYVKLSYLHIAAWTGDRDARNTLQEMPERSTTVSLLAILEMILRNNTAPDVSLDDDLMKIALAIARSPFGAEKRMLPLLLIRYGHWQFVIRLAERLKNETEYGSSSDFDQFRYFALTSALEEYTQGNITEEDWKTSPYSLAQPNDLREFFDDVELKAKNIVRDRPMESYETVGDLKGLETYGLLELSHNLLRQGRKTEALMIAQSTFVDLLSGRGSAHSELVQSDEFKRLAILFAMGGELYRARRIGESLVSKAERLEVWTAIIRSYRERITLQKVAYTDHISALWEEKIRERGMKRGFDAPWNDNRW